jgi:hypothetical protein
VILRGRAGTLRGCRPSTGICLLFALLLQHGRFCASAGGKVKALATVNDCKGRSFFRYRKIREIGNKPLSAFLSETLDADCTVNTDKKKVFLVGDFLTRKADLNSAVGGDFGCIKIVLVCCAEKRGLKTNDQRV